MQIQVTLTMALDFQKKKGVPHETYSYLADGVWHVVKCGPGYSNTYKVTHYDAEGLAKLRSIRRDPTTGEALLSDEGRRKTTE